MSTWTPVEKQVRSLPLNRCWNEIGVQVRINVRLHAAEQIRAPIWNLIWTPIGSKIMGQFE